MQPSGPWLLGIALLATPALAQTHGPASDAGLEKAAEHAGFEKQAGAWVLPGRFEAFQAEEISGPGWKGIAVTQACSVSDVQTGFHAAGGKCLTAVLSARDRSVVVQTPGQPPPGSEVGALLRSVRFLESRK